MYIVDVSMLNSTAQIITQEQISVIRKFLGSVYEPGVSAKEAISKNVVQSQNYHQDAKEKHDSYIYPALMMH